MRRVIQLLRKGAFHVVAICLYATTRWYATVSEVATRFPDSLGYEHLTLVGVNERLWSVPFVYSLAHSSHQRVIAHVVIGTVAWAYVAWRIALLTRWHKGLMTLVLLIGLTPQVIHFDLAILSESLGISFAVGAVAATLHVVQSRTRFANTLWLVFLTLTAFTRPTHLIVLFICTLYCIVAYTLSGRKNRKLSALLLAILSLWGFMQYRGNESESILNFYTVLQRRIIVDNASYEWFIQHGMPDIPGIRASRGYARADQLDAEVRDFVRLPMKQVPPMSMVTGGIPLATWVRNHGWNTYTKFLISHPSSMRSIVSHRTAQALSPSDETFLPTQSHPIVPRQIFNPWWAWMLLLTSSLAITWFSRARAAIARALTLLTVVTAVVFIISLLMSAIEYERHAVTSSVLLRVLALACFAAAVGHSEITELDVSSAERGFSSSRDTKKT